MGITYNIQELSQNIEDCPDCEGSGWEYEAFQQVYTKNCERCDGEGWILVEIDND